MVSVKVRNYIRAVFILVAFSLPLSAHSTSATVFLDYGLDLFDDHRYQNAEVALVRLLKSSSFRQLDTAQRSLAYSHIAYSLINQGKDRESVKYIDKALAQSKKEFGERSLPYLSMLRTKAIATYWSGNPRKAQRIGGRIVDTLERMDGDYRDELIRVRQMTSRMGKSNMVKRELPLDLSDFYSDCESIDNETYLARVDSIMNDYLQVGRDFKPDHKQSLYFKNTYLQHARESTKDRKTRIIYIPDDEHMHDWCVVYPDRKHISKVMIAASNDH